MSLSRYFLRMIIFLMVISLITILISDQLLKIFTSNLGLNSIIIGTFFVGLLYSFRHYFSLHQSLKWLAAYKTQKLSTSQTPPQFLKSIQRGRLNIDFNKETAKESCHFLDTIYSKLEEYSVISKYLVSSLVFLGLLGTFWGLALTIQSVSSVIADLPEDSHNLAFFLKELKNGLHIPLSGMAIAFSSSLFGLGCSLVLGFIVLQSSQASTWFYQTIEQMFQTRTHTTAITPGSSIIPGDSYNQALMSQLIEHMENIQNSLANIANNEEKLSHHLTELSKIQQLTKTGEQFDSLNTTITEMIKTMNTNHANLNNTVSKEVRLLTKTLSAKK